MSYPSKLKLEPKLCETLFLLLALQSDKKINEKTGFSLRSIAVYKEKLMWLFFETTEVHEELIFHAAKSCAELVEFLVKEYGHTYSALVHRD